MTRMTLAEWCGHQEVTTDAEWGVEVVVWEARDRAAEARAADRAREVDRMGSLAPGAVFPLGSR